jgi:hypothetical protein
MSTSERMTSEPHLGSPHGLSLIDLEHNLKFQENRSIRFPKPDGPILTDSAFVDARAADEDRVNLHPSGI